MASVSATRVSGENFIYEASFKPTNSDPFWEGHLKKYSIIINPGHNDDGGIGAQQWDAGEVLQSRAPASPRNIWTCITDSPGHCSMTGFGSMAWGQFKGYLDVGDSSTAQAIAGYIRGNSANNPDNWKLGDIFHSNPVTVGSPSFYYIDVLSPAAFTSFREHKSNRERIVFVGANDGQFRAFSASDGSEKWSFIRPNLLPKLQYIAHSTHPTSLRHKYFVDGPVTAADVWLGSGNGTNKVEGEWSTQLVFSEGRGVRDSTNTTAKYLWSKSASCDSQTADFYKNYNEPGSPPTVYQYYCGYWAFDVTDTSATTPYFKWRINITDPSQGPYLGEPWSKMAIGRVKIHGDEKWIGFIGGGYNADPNNDPNGGKGFFVVDLSNGNILWSYTKGNDANMTYSIPASPAIVDTDNDGFVDTAYIGDLGGNVWRFKFCTDADGSACGTSNWSGGKFFQSSTATPIYTTPSVARASGSTWVFWGTGDKENPTLIPNPADKFFAVKDDQRTGTYTLSNLEDITSSMFNGGNYSGWYITLLTGEKVLADSSVFGGMVTWTTYTPAPSTDPCQQQVGTAKLYAVAMMPVKIGTVTYQVGAGLFATTGGNEVGVRSVAIGKGIAQTPVFSQKPGGTGDTDVFITASGGVTGGTAEDSSIVTSPRFHDTPFKTRLHDTAPSAQVIHWWDQRVH